MARTKKQITVNFENYLIVCRGLLTQVMKTLWGPVAKRVLRAITLLMEAENSGRQGKHENLFSVLSGIINDELSDDERARLMNYMRVNKHLQGKPKSVDDRQFDLFTGQTAQSAWDKVLDRIAEQDAEDFD